MFFYVTLIGLNQVDLTSCDENPLETILFGSCIRQDQPVPIFKSINRLSPDLFIFLGDNIYADTEDMQVMQNKYAKLGADSGFRELRDKTKLLATWDDHDYGKNDAGSEYTKKVQSQKLFLDFWKEPRDSLRRRTPGIYDAKTFGPRGKRVQVILLDTRFFRGPLKTGLRKTGGPYYPTENQSVTMLGETQWSWLEKQLLQPAEIRIIASSIQLVASSDGQETWSNIPHERERFFELLRKTKSNGVLLISGDRHWSELSACSRNLPYVLYDLTSSSLNQPHGRGTPTLNVHRANNVTYHKENFGEIRIFWEQPDPRIMLRIRDLKGHSKLEKELTFEDLRGKP